MASFTVEAHLVDGSLLDFPGTPALLKKLRMLQTRGLTGKQLIHELLTDDWGPPPNVIVISGTDPDGNPINVRIPYR